MIYAVFFMIMSGVICFIFLNREQQSVMPISVTEIRRMKCFAERIASGDLDTPLEMDRGDIKYLLTRGRGSWMDRYRSRGRNLPELAFRS